MILDQFQFEKILQLHSLDIKAKTKTFWYFGLKKTSTLFSIIYYHELFLYSTGVAPPSFLFIRAGTTLYELTTTTGHISILSILILTLLAILSLLPVALRKWLRRKVE